MVIFNCSGDIFSWSISRMSVIDGALILTPLGLTEEIEKDFDDLMTYS